MEHIRQNCLPPSTNLYKPVPFKIEAFEMKVYCTFVSFLRAALDNAFDWLKFWLKFIIFEPQKLPEAKTELDT